MAKPAAIIAYVPVVHRGYLDLFARYPGADIYVLGEPFLREFPLLARDLRAMPPSGIVVSLRALLPGRLVEELGNSLRLAAVAREAERLILPDEQIMRVLASRYMPAGKAEYVRTFLRWEKALTTQEFEIPPDRTVSVDELDREFMAAAFQAADRSSDWWRQVGGVLVRDKEIKLSLWNRHQPTEYSLCINGDPRSDFEAGERFDLCGAIHAEAAIIAAAARNGIPTADSFLYLTVFPCPSCAYLVKDAGIKRVCYAKGYSVLAAEEILRGAGVEIVLVK